MAFSYPEPTVIQPSKEHRYTAIFLHGRGSDGESFVNDLFSGITSTGHSLETQFPHMKWVFPTTKLRYSTSWDETMTEWFDIASLQDTDLRDETQIEGLHEAITHIHEILKKETEIVGPNNLVLGGISQGCAVAIHALLSYDTQLAGFVGACSWFPFAKYFEDHYFQPDGGLRTDTLNDFYREKLLLTLPAAALQRAEPPQTPILLTHSTLDGVVECRHGRRLARVLRRLGCNVDLRLHVAVEHWIAEPQGYDDIVAFLTKQLQIPEEAPSKEATQQQGHSKGESSIS